MLRRLCRGKIGTSEVVSLAGRICSKLANNKPKTETLVQIVMKWKVQDAKKDFNRSRHENTTVWREIKPILREEGVVEQYEVLWAHAKEKLHREERKRMNRKVNFLRKKYSQCTDVDNNIVHGVMIGDVTLTEEYESMPRIYGGCNIANDEEELFSLPPKFSMCDKVNAENMEVQIEKMEAKLRWEIRQPHGVDENGEPVVEDRDHFYDIKDNKFDFSVMRPTELPFNKKVCLPKAVELEHEVAMHDLKTRLIKVTETYVASNTNKPSSNLTETEKSGLKSIKQKVKNGDIVVFETDKSSRLSVDSPTNYRLACAPHIQNDEVVSIKEHDQIENQLSAHAVMWSRMLKAGSALNQEKRVTDNMRSKSSPIAPLYTSRKDHKPIPAGNGEKGPPVRPVCGAQNSHNNKLSHILCTLLDPVWQTKDNVNCCMSTEEMKADIEKINTSNVNTPIIVGSADVKALYPSLDIDFTIDKVCEMFQESSVKVDGIDYEEMGLYLAFNTTRARLTELQLDRVCPTRKCRNGKLKITGNGIKPDREERYAPWRRPTENPTPEQQRIMLVEALRVAMNLVMHNHMYMFDKSIRRQLKGGAIGLKLTGSMAQVFMMWWDREMIHRLQALMLPPLMYDRYVDDIDVALHETPLGAVIRNGEMMIDDDAIERDLNIPADARAMQIFLEIGNGIHESIQLEIDFPSNHPDNKVPILDLKVWVDKNMKIVYEHYSKEVSSKYTVHVRSAMSMKVKRTILTQDALRILLNCSRQLPWETKVRHLETFVKRMQFSGYGIKIRSEVIKSAVSAYRRMETADVRGETPLFREQGWKWEERKIKNRDKKVTWFRRGGYQSVLFVPATPASQLQRRLSDEVDKSKFKIRVVELAGGSIKKSLQRSDPFKSDKCLRPNCAVCETGGIGPCDGIGVTYEVLCNHDDCNGEYAGQTARNMHERGGEHLKGLSNRNKESVLWKHCVNAHGSIQQKFTVNVTGRYDNDAMMRQVAEAVRIRRNKPSMNSKDEWNFIHIPRVVTT